jgi:Protein of unknown function (DUF1592)/Protein of unknown function (DUF1588)/Protein of unknown function (DUF1595)/Protein of unknown function (DUF1585)/Protein of unknown function (DUF1587)
MERSGLARAWVVRGVLAAVPPRALLVTALAGCATGPQGPGKEALAAAPVVARESVVAAPSASGYSLPARAPGSAASFPAQAPASVAAETQFARLSHSQYLHTVRDLFDFGDLPDVVFSPDALNGFGFETSTAFRVDPRLGPQYRAMAEALAERAVKEPASFARIVPCAAGAPDCRAQFLRSFGERAFRRPLSAEDLATFSKRFDAGVAFYQSGDAFRDGVRMTVEVMLQSPEFLYRLEPSPVRAAGGRRQLDDFEVAARLSYFLYDSMPDEPLFAAARAGQLHTPDQVEAAARRMLGDARVLEKLVAFHEQAWQFGRFASISPDAATYPQVPKALVWRVRRATTLFVRDVLQSGGGLVELLTAPYAYADPGLAPLYGVPRAAPELTGAQASAGRFTRVRFDPQQRKGLLMQVGYLAANAYSISTDPIHRGLFVIRNLLCREVPDPPPGATTTPPPATEQAIVTTRDEVSLVTGQSFCPTCHAEINAPGFAFEGFDAVGQERGTDNGAPVDTSGQMVLDGQLVHFEGPAELVDLLAQSKEAHRCYARRWMEFVYGRPLAQSDVPTLDIIAANSLPIAEILVAIVRSPEFLSP